MEIRVLGPVEFWAHGETLINIRGPRQRTMLAVLAIEAPRVVSVDELKDRVWSHDPPTASTLYSHICRLRQAMKAGAARIVSRGSGYALDVDPFEIDLHRFRRMVAHAASVRHPELAAGAFDIALNLWRGPALAGITGEWAQTTRNVLEEERWAAQLSRNEASIQCGRVGDVLDALFGMHNARPDDELVAKHLMLALYRVGRSKDALDVYDKVYKRARDVHGQQPAHFLQMTQRQILNDDVDSVVSHSLAASTPMTLPYVRPVLVGRGNELQTAGELLRPGTILLLDGVGGVGKTTLAVHLVQQRRHLYPDGVLFADLGGSGPLAPIEPEEVMRSFLQSLHVEAGRIPFDSASLRDLYQSTLADTGTLILLDNAATEQQVRPLLPNAPDSSVLVTSRRVLSGLVAREGAGRIAINVLPTEDSVTLLNTHLDPLDQLDILGVRRLAGLCGGLPLALCLAGQRAGRVRGGLTELINNLTTRGELIRTLDIDGDPLAAVGSVLSWSLQHLSRSVTSSFDFLAQNPGYDFDVHAAAAVTRTTVQRASHLLRSLCSAHLLEEPTVGRFQMHDLLKALSVEQRISEQDRTIALSRLFWFTYRTSDAADRALAPHRRHVPPLEEEDEEDVSPPVDTYEGALHWYQFERQNLRRIIEQAANVNCHAHVWRIAACLLPFYFLRKDWTDWLAVHELALTSTRAIGDEFGEAWILHDLGLAYTDLHRFGEAIRSYNVAVEIRQRIGDLHGVAKSSTNLGDVYRLMGKPAEAEAHLSASLKVCRMIHDDYSEGIVWNNLGDVAIERSQPRKAIRHYQKALRLARNISHQYSEGFALNGLGEAYRLLGDSNGSLHHFTEAIRVRVEAGDQRGEAVSKCGLAEVLYAEGRVAEATVRLGEAVSILEGLGDPEAASAAKRLADIAGEAAP